MADNFYRWPSLCIEVFGKPTYLKGFDPDNVVFAPAGKLGTLYNAISMEKLRPTKDKTYANFGPTLVAKWAESDPLVEFTGMEMNAFPGLNIDGIFILDTAVVQADYV